MPSTPSSPSPRMTDCAGAPGYFRSCTRWSSGATCMKPTAGWRNPCTRPSARRSSTPTAIWRPAALKTMLPWAMAHFEEARRELGEDYWSYGFANNRETLATFLRYSHERAIEAAPAARTTVRARSASNRSRSEPQPCLTATGDKRSHSLTDHQYGVDTSHTHEGNEGADHDHDYLGPEGPLEENPIWIQDHVSLLSVGVDIGSSGTQVIFSRVNLAASGQGLSPAATSSCRARPCTSRRSRSRRTRARSASTTPRSGAFVDAAYAQARAASGRYRRGRGHPDGRSAAQARTRRRSRTSWRSTGGEFVCASAGRHMEAMLAAYQVRERHAYRTRCRESASSTSTSAAAPPSSPWSRPGA